MRESTSGGRFRRFWRELRVSCDFTIISIKGDVKENTSPSTGGRGNFLGVQPLSATRDAWLWCRAPRTWVLVFFHLGRFIFWSRRRQPVSETWQALRLYGVNHGSICDSGPIAFSGCPRGHRVYTETGCQRHRVPTGVRYTHPRTRASQEPTGHHQRDQRRWKGLFTRDAQAACGFSFSGSKPSPFFHRVRVMAAILRASVRRAIVGFMPLASKTW